MAKKRAVNHNNEDMEPVTIPMQDDQVEETSAEETNDTSLEDAMILSACIAAIKDPVTGGPMDKNNFNACLPLFMEQAYTLFFNVKRMVNMANKDK